MNCTFTDCFDCDGTGTTEGEPGKLLAICTRCGGCGVLADGRAPNQGQMIELAKLLAKGRQVGPTLDEALAAIPEGWYLHLLQDMRTPVRYRGDTHVHVCWRAELQWVDGGGRLTWANGDTPAQALHAATVKVIQNTARRAAAAGTLDLEGE